MHEVGIDHGMTPKLGRQLDQQASALGRDRRRGGRIVILGMASGIGPSWT